MLGRVAGDQRAVDGADRSADHPVGFDPRLVQRLIHPCLVRAERAAALEDEDHLPFAGRTDALRGVHAMAGSSQ
jgi:hypothetical protein